MTTWVPPEVYAAKRAHAEALAQADAAARVAQPQGPPCRMCGGVTRPKLHETSGYVVYRCVNADCLLAY